MNAVRLVCKTKIPIPLLSSQQSFVPFSSSPAVASNPRSRTSFFDEFEGISEVYRHALKFQRPTTIRWQNRLFNSASFIATVVQPLAALNAAANGNLCAYTFLRVSVSHQSSGGFRILLDMRDEMAEMCFQHLKENDFVYVSGRLVANTKSDQNGNLRIFDKLLVKELNYVTQRHDTTCQEYEELESAEAIRMNGGMPEITSCIQEAPISGTSITGEALWLSPNDPPWIKKQLNLLNSEMGLGEQLGP